MLSDRITTLFNLLDCNNSDIARELNISPSNISRIHTGSRTYKPTDRPIIRFAEGIYSYADQRNLLHVINNLCETDELGRDSLVPTIIAWLFDTDVQSLSQLVAVNSINKKASLARNNRSFGEKLNDVMNLLEMSNTRLARLINVDSSHISRFRNGVRSPIINSTISNLLTSVLINRAIAQDRLSDLSKLTCIVIDILSDEENAIPAFCEWLYRNDNDIDTSSIDRLLDCIDSFSSNSNPSLPDISSFVTDHNPDESTSIYWGIEGLREAVLRFLSNASKSPSELWLYSDQDMEWMIGDKNFFGKWYALMLSCVKQGVRIRIIHNIDRGTNEMISAIQGWIPLYMSGLIEPYICRRGRDTRFSHTLFINPGSECICASHIKGTEHNGCYDYYTDAKRLNMLSDEFTKLLSLSHSLLRMYINNTNKLFTEAKSGKISALLSSLSLGTIPDELINSLLIRNNIADSKAEQIKEFCNIQKRTMENSLNSDNVYELISLPSDDDLFSGKVPVNLTTFFSKKAIYYTAEEYALHIRSIANLIKNNTSYHLCILPELPFSGIQIILNEDSVTVIRSSSQCVAFVFTEPMMVNAFIDYFNSLKNRYDNDRNKILQLLNRFI